MRSKLFVPASRPELFAKAIAGPADALSFDLEDAVVEARKDEARTILGRWLQANAALAGSKQVIVRVNALDTPHFAADVAAVVRPGVHSINLPKPQSVDEVRTASAAIAQAMQRNAVMHPVGLLLNIETPRALRLAAELASADPRVDGLQLGLGDLFEPLGIDRRESSAIQHAMMAVRLAAGEAGVPAYDSAFANIADSAGFRAEAELASRLGFAGKTCIHPSQVQAANEVFRPSDAEIEYSLKVVDAAERADAAGTGAYVVDGKMIDGPFIARARSIVATARQLGLIPNARNS